MNGHASTLFDLSHRASRRLPMRYELGTQLTVEVKDRSQHATFWATFSSPDYFSVLAPLQEHLDDHRISDLMLIDGGAEVGMFSLFMEHCVRLGLLRARVREFHCIEASPTLAASLRHNLEQLANAHQYAGDIGTRAAPARALPQRCPPAPRVDVWPLLQGHDILLKLCPRALCSAFLDEYDDALHHVVALVIVGDAPRPDDDWRERLADCGFHSALSAGVDRPYAVELYLRTGAAGGRRS